jgi:hypothetical protein
MQASNSFNLDLTKLVAWLTPKALRKAKFAVIIKAMVFPLISLHNAFMKYRKAKLYQLQISPQVCYLERMLNDRFDYSLRRIEIADAAWHLPSFIFQEEELKPLAIYREDEDKPLALYTEGEAGIALNDFVVLVPSAISFADAEMRALIDSFKLFGTKYSIQTF